MAVVLGGAWAAAGANGNSGVWGRVDDGEAVETAAALVDAAVGAGAGVGVGVGVGAVTVAVAGRASAGAGEADWALGAVTGAAGSASPLRAVVPAPAPKPADGLGRTGLTTVGAFKIIRYGPWAWRNIASLRPGLEAAAAGTGAAAGFGAVWAIKGVATKSKEAQSSGASSQACLRIRDNSNIVKPSCKLSRQLGVLTWREHQRTATCGLQAPAKLALRWQTVREVG